MGSALRRVLIGRPRAIWPTRSLFHRLSLVPFLAWVGLGADGLSSSAYGPDEAYRTLFTGGACVPGPGPGWHDRDDGHRYRLRVQPDHRAIPRRRRLRRRDQAARTESA